MDKHVFETSVKEMVTQAQDSHSILNNKRHIVTPEVLAQFPNSPTAKRHMVAYQHYKNGLKAFDCYLKDTVENDSDCEQLQPAFHGYAKGHMLESHMMCQFSYPRNKVELIEQYLQIRPNDVLVKYFKVIYKVFNKSADGLSDYEFSKDKIRSLEIMVNEILPFKTLKTERSILIALYYWLGGQYVITRQDERALYSFEKSYNLDTNNIAALYAVANKYIDIDPDKAIRLFNKYLTEAPKCDDKYPHTYYLLGFLYIKHCNNANEAAKYNTLGLTAEQKWRLPFQAPVDIPKKRSLQSYLATVNSTHGHQHALVN